MSGIEIGTVGIAFAAVLVLTWVFRRRARQASRRFQILDDIARVADGGRSLEETLDAIAEILVPELGDFCLIDVIEGDSVRRAAVRVAGPEAKALEIGLSERPPLLQKEMASAASTGRLEPRLFERLSDADLRGFAKDEADFEFLRSVGGSSAVAVELRARGRPTGLLTIGVRGSGRRFRHDDAHFVGILAGRVALALDNAGLFSDLERSERERAEIAETLQRGLLPPPLPHIPGWAVAAMYRPAGAENEIGGDFYDAFRIAGGWMVVIGDVTGRGAQAASVTAHAALHAAHRGGADRRPGGRAGNPQPRAAGPPWRHPLQCRGDGDRGRPDPASAPRRRRPPGAAAGRRRLGHRGDRLGAGARRL